MSTEASVFLRICVLAATLAFSIPTHAEPAFGMFPVVYEGILVPDPEELKNSSGPIVFRAIDLDHGTEQTKTGVETDISLALNVIPLTFLASGRAASDVADAGAAPVGLKQCQALLSPAVAHPQIAEQKAITNYFCVRTAQGRTAIFRVRLVGVKYLPDSFATVAAVIEYFVWNSTQPDAQMGSIRQGINFDQGDLFSRPANSAEQCSAICNATDQCIAVTFVISQDRCWLKDRLNAIRFSDDMASALRGSRSQ